MIEYEDMIFQWQKSVSQYCARRNIPNMELCNLRKGDVYDYALHAAYRQAKDAVDTYRKTPVSPLYAAEMVRAIKKWYVAAADKKFQKVSMQIIPNNLFARLISHTK